MFRRLFRSLLGDESGQSMAALSILLVPVLTFGGMGLDLSYGWALKSQLFTYAQTAANKAIGSRSAGLREAVAMAGDGPVKDAAEQTRTLFMESLPDAFIDRGVGVKTVVRRKASTLMAEITFKTELPTHFLRYFGVPSLTISGSSYSEKQLDPYHDFTLFLDNSPSMGIAASPFDQNLMRNNTPDGCVFACHVTDGRDSNYHIARRIGAQLRVDKLAEATKRVLRNTLRRQQFPGQFRFAAYTFGRDSADNPPHEISSLKSDLMTTTRELRGINLMTTRRPGYRGDMVSDFDMALRGLATLLGSSGDGQTAANPRKTLVMVTDGLANSRKPEGCSKPLRYRRCQSPIDVAACDALKEKGIAIAILYTPYPTLPGNRWYDEWIAPFAEEIGPALEACATPGLYAESADDDDISAKLTSLIESHINLGVAIASLN